MMPKSNSLSVGIVGAGTAGLAAAIALARADHHVTVFEKHSAMLPLGAGVLIQPQGVAALDMLGVGNAFHGASVPVTGLLGTCHRNWKLVDIRYDGTPARGVSRQALSQVLLDAALSLGVRIRFGSPVDRIQSDGTTASVHVGSTVCAFDLVVMADGAASTLPAQAGLAMASNIYEWGALWAMFDVAHWPNEALLEQRYHGTRKMFGLMPTAWVDGKLRLSMFWSLPCRDHAEWRTRPLEDWKAELLALWPGSAPVVNQIVSHDQFAFATYRHARARRLANGPVCVIGDAAHSMSPQLGLGTTLAVQDALALADAVGERGAIAGAAMYSSRRLGVVRNYQWLSKALTPCFQAHGGGLWRDVLFAAGVNIPGIKSLMARSIAAPASGDRQASAGTVDAMRID
jgi:2-polyprenyl-6-methoxyphenol hydroxylase-like FAD-dependent oxidoreductase